MVFHHASNTICGAHTFLMQTVAETRSPDVWRRVGESELKRETKAFKRSVLTCCALKCQTESVKRRFSHSDIHGCTERVCCFVEKETSLLVSLSLSLTLSLSLCMCPLPVLLQCVFVCPRLSLHLCEWCTHCVCVLERERDTETERDRTKRERQSKKRTRERERERQTDGRTDDSSLFLCKVESPSDRVRRPLQVSCAPSPIGNWLELFKPKLSHISLSHLSDDVIIAIQSDVLPMILWVRSSSEFHFASCLAGKLFDKHFWLIDYFSCFCTGINTKSWAFSCESRSKDKNSFFVGPYRSCR